MALSAVAITPVNDPNSLDDSNAASKVYPPQPGTTTTANDVGSAEQVLRNQTHTLNEVKVNRAGDTMTDTLVITTSTANQPALNATGNGTGSGVDAIGGATGRGGTFQAGGGNAIGVYSTGSGTGAGVSGLGGAAGNGGEFIAGGGNASGVLSTGNGSGNGITATGGATGKGGAFVAGGGNTAGLSSVGTGTGAGAALTGGTTGPGLTATNGTAQIATAPTVAGQFAGYVEMTGADPNPTVDPGANNALHGANILKSWVVFDDSYNILDGYNIASITNVAGAIHKITFVRAMLNTTYGVKVHVNGLPGYSGAHNGVKNLTDFNFVLFKTDTLALGMPVGGEGFIEVTGRQ